MYATGKGTQLDYDKAVNWLQKTADQGNEMAQYSLKLLSH